MSNIFISYAHEDRPIAEKLAQTLAAESWDVFWDREISTGQNWPELLDDELAKARCVVVLWSKPSVASRHVFDEATIGIQRKVLFPVFIQPGTLPPIGFRKVQTADLTAWDGSRDDPAMRQLIADIAKSLAAAEPEQAQKEAEAKRIRELLAARRQFRKRYTLLAWALGAGLGAGLGVFLLRALVALAIKSRVSPIVVGVPNGIYAGILGGGLVVGMGLGDQIWRSATETAASKFSFLRTFGKREVVFVLFGMVFFMAVHTALAAVNSLAPLSAAILHSTWAALGAGAALSIALNDQPYAGWRLPVFSWLGRLVLVATAFALVQAPFAFRKVPGIGLILAGSLPYYRAGLERITPGGNDAIAPYLAMGDGSLLGVVLCVGITFGLAQAADRFARALKNIDVD